MNRESLVLLGGRSISLSFIVKMKIHEAVAFPKTENFSDLMSSPKKYF